MDNIIMDNIIYSLEKIGHGSYGSVYIYNNNALKVINLNINDIEDRIDTYLTVLKELYLQYIISIFKFKYLIPIIKCDTYNDKNIKIIMPKFDLTLRKGIITKKYNHFILNNLLKIIKNLVNSVHTLHNKLFICHGDIKPSNIFLNINEINGELILTDTVLADYGLILLNPITDIAVIQTRWYRSPSAQILYLGKAKYKIDARYSDIWAIGCIIYEVIINEVAFKSNKDKTHLNFIKNNYDKVINNLNMYIQNNKTLKDERILAKIALIMLNDPYINNKNPPDIKEVSLLLGMDLNNNLINTTSRYRLLNISRKTILKWDGKYCEKDLEKLDKKFYSIIKLYQNFKPNNIISYMLCIKKIPTKIINLILAFCKKK